MCNKEGNCMKKIFAIALVFSGAFLFASTVRAQNFIAITATVTDPNGIPYGAGTMSAVLTPGTPGGWTLGGQPYSGRIGPVTLDSTGKFTANFGNNSAILPAGTRWQITVNSNQGGIAPPLGTGAQTFTVTVTLNSSQDISATLNAAAPKLTNITVGAGSVISVSCGNLANIFTCAVANPTTTPALSFTPVAGAPTISGTISASHLVYASGANTAADVAGSSVTGANGQISLKPTADAANALALNPNSQTFGAVKPALEVNGGTGTISCTTKGIYQAQVCLNGATN